MLPDRDDDMFVGENSMSPIANKYRTQLRRLETAALIAAKHLRPNRARVHIDRIDMTHEGVVAHFSCGGIPSDEHGTVEVDWELFEQLCTDAPKN